MQAPQNSKRQRMCCPQHLQRCVMPPAESASGGFAGFGGFAVTTQRSFPSPQLNHGQAPACGQSQHSQLRCALWQGSGPGLVRSMTQPGGVLSTTHAGQPTTLKQLEPTTHSRWCSSQCSINTLSRATTLWQLTGGQTGSFAARNAAVAAHWPALSF